MLKLRKVVLKPSVFCFHRCGYCKPRQKYYREILRKTNGDEYGNSLSRVQHGHMPLQMALRQIQDAHALGMTECLFSGGDPLLYLHLTELVQAAAAPGGVFVYMNSLGSGVEGQKVRELMDAGLCAWNFSVDSIDAPTYDRIRGVTGAYQRLMEAVDIVGTARATHRRDFPLFINFMTVITRHNYRDLPQLVKAALEKQISSVYFMNVYGDDGVGEFLLSKEEIRDLRDRVVPAILDVLHRATVPELVYSNCQEVLATFYSPDNCDENYEQGIWWTDLPTAKNACRIPEYCVHIEPGGRVLPCCMVEISHDNAVGDVKWNTLEEVWNGQAFRSFRMNKMDFCLRCPVQRNRTLGLIPEMCRQFGD